jgi:dynein heavy chain
MPAATPVQVDLMNSLFETHKENPPLFKNQPPVAGAIHWEKSLFHRMKSTMLQFLPIKEMMSSIDGEKAKAKYLAVGRRMKAYSDNLHADWFARVEETLPQILRQTLFVRLRSDFERSKKSLDPTSTNQQSRGLSIFATVSEIFT